MAKWGRTDFKRLKRMLNKLEKLSRVDYEKFCEEVAKEIAARFLARVIKRTPVGQYDDGTVGGTLRRGWTSDSHKEAELGSTFGGGGGAKKYVDSMRVKKFGPYYEIDIINPVEYAMYVEFGHRTRDHQGWVPGRFMMTISADEVEKLAPKLIEKKLLKLLKEAFDGN